MKRLGLLDLVMDGSSRASAVAGAKQGDATSVATYAGVDDLDQDIEGVNADSNVITAAFADTVAFSKIICSAANGGPATLRSSRVFPESSQTPSKISLNHF